MSNPEVNLKDAILDHSVRVQKGVDALQRYKFDTFSDRDGPLCSYMEDDNDGEYVKIADVVDMLNAADGPLQMARIKA